MAAPPDERDMDRKFEDRLDSDRFSVARRLGAGGMGVVYEAEDHERGQRVALKTLRERNPATLYWFKREFRALADVLHPNLIRLHELFADGDLWYFSMELVEGVDFLEYVRPGLYEDWATLQGLDGSRTTAVRPPSAPAAVSDEDTVAIAPAWTPAPPTLAGEAPAPETPTPVADEPVARLYTDRLRPALRQLAAGVQTIHAAGKLHRDLKPSNVLVTPEGRVVILDFGLIVEAGPERPFVDPEGHISGTVSYMSPEQAGGQPLSPASDWYTVGVMLFEALTGRPPFLGQAMAVLGAKQFARPPAPSSLARDVPEDLERLCTDLLRRDVDRRPVGPEILRRLGGEAAVDLLSEGAAAPGALFVGRAGQLERLDQAYAASREHRAVVARVHGAPGIGKTALSRTFLDRLERRERDAVLLRGRCFEREMVPFKAFDGLIDELAQVLRDLPPEELQAALPEGISALARLFPVLQRVEAVRDRIRGSAPVPDALQLRRLAFVALRQLLSGLCRSRPMVLFIDDLQWGDLDSAALLRELLRPPTPPSLLLVLAYRSGDAESSPCLQEVLPWLAGSGCAAAQREVPVEALSAGEGLELAATLLEDADETAQLVAREASGDPFFILELARYRMDRQAQDEAAPDATSHEPSAPSLREVMQWRFSRLPEDARRLLEVVAVAGRPVERIVARGASGLGPAEHEALDQLVAAHLVRSRSAGEGAQVVAYHDRIREAVVERLSDERRRAHHRSLAETLQQQPEPDPLRLTLHFREAGEPAQAAGYAAEAAARAQEALAFDQAAQLYRDALELGTWDRDQERDLQARLGESLVQAGLGSDGADVLLAAAEGAPIERSSELRRSAAEQLMRCGRIEDGIQVIEDVLTQVGLRLHRQPWRSMLSMALHKLWLRLRGLRFRPRREVPREEILRIDCCWAVSASIGIVDTACSADFAARHLLYAARAGEPVRFARALGNEAALSSIYGGRGHRRTTDLMHRARALVERAGDPFLLGSMDLARGLFDYLSGRWREGFDVSERSVQYFLEHCKGVTYELYAGQIYTMVSSLYLGRLDRLADRLPAMVHSAADRGDRFVETAMRSRLVHMLHLMDDEPEPARRQLREALARWPAIGFHNAHYSAMVSEVEIALYEGDASAAWGHVERVWPGLRRSMMLFIQHTQIEAHHVRARAALGVAAERRAAGEGPDAVRRWLREVARDARKMERERMPWGRGLARLIRGAAEATRGEPDRALGLLDEAQRLLEESDTLLYAAACRRRRGELIGGDEGSGLVDEADAFFEGQGVRRPERMTRMLAPGWWSG